MESKALFTLTGITTSANVHPECTFAKLKRLKKLTPYIVVKNSYHKGTEIFNTFLCYSKYSLTYV